MDFSFDFEDSSDKVIENIVKNAQTANSDSDEEYEVGVQKKRIKNLISDIKSSYQESILILTDRTLVCMR